MIVWLNGTFGVGKTTTSQLLAKTLPAARVFDSERVGELLVPILEGVPCNDFQEWDPWRALVVETAARVLDYVGGILVIPQSVLVQQYWDEISTGLSARGIPIAHFVLHADEHTLIQRIENDPAMPGSQWRLDHVTAYQQALPWLRGKGTVIETDRLTPIQVAETISSLIS
ncbi:MAG: AAA family ATPase [Actinocrinis sp.]